jgi:segregation and condensation protein A
VSEADQTELDLAAAEEAEGREALMVALDAFEGPLHLLLELARAHKIDIAKISIGEIADQYLAFIEGARAANMEIAGDYLVMAAWLALLKSRLLIPKPQLAEDEPDPQQLEAALRARRPSASMRCPSSAATCSSTASRNRPF